MDKVEDKNPAAKNGVTPFHNAAHVGHFEICKLILENVVKLDAP